ncbi:hypothetical protein BHM03_00050351 [Ensete ventricosum]|nr:hypothetical protein BHM03_00050351 [Ensete ventricosum]
MSRLSRSQRIWMLEAQKRREEGPSQWNIEIRYKGKEKKAHHDKSLRSNIVKKGRRPAMGKPDIHYGREGKKIHYSGSLRSTMTEKGRSPAMMETQNLIRRRLRAICARGMSQEDVTHANANPLQRRLRAKCARGM